MKLHSQLVSRAQIWVFSILAPACFAPACVDFDGYNLEDDSNGQSGRGSSSHETSSNGTVAGSGSSATSSSYQAGAGGVAGTSSPANSTASNLNTSTSQGGTTGAGGDTGTGTGTGSGGGTGTGTGTGSGGGTGTGTGSGGGTGTGTGSGGVTTIGTSTTARTRLASATVERGALVQSSATCRDGFESCDGTCTDLRTDNDNCGKCGTQCSDLEYCSGGSCSCTGFACADNRCIPISMVCDGDRDCDDGSDEAACVSLLEFLGV